MKNSKKIIVGTLILLISVILAYFFLSQKNNQSMTGMTIENINQEQQEKYTYLIFIDKNSSCEVNGKVYINDELIGTTQNGALYVSLSEYNEKFLPNSTLYISGTTSSCFEKDSNLPFMEFWDIPDLRTYFDNNQNVTFDLALDPRHPRYIGEIQGFIRPDEVTDYYTSELRKYTNNDTEHDLDRITSFYMNYRGTDLVFDDVNYWRTPNEVLESGFGDCKNWAVTALSLIKAYNPSLDCYNALWPTHMSIFCYFNNTFIIYDQKRVKSEVSFRSKQSGYLAEQENKVKVREMLNNYYDQYGLRPDGRQLSYLISDTEIIPFNDSSNEEFVNWIIDTTNS